MCHEIIFPTEEVSSIFSSRLENCILENDSSREYESQHLIKKIMFSEQIQSWYKESVLLDFAS